MRIQRTPRACRFTVLGNDILQHKGLSFIARGILGYLLSLPDGAREDVRTLADNNPGVGRRGVAKALDELVAAGYYVRRTVRDTGTGQIRTETWVYDRPQDAEPPLPAPPGTGRPANGSAGTFPYRNKNREKEPTHPAALAAYPRTPSAANSVPPQGRSTRGTTPAGNGDPHPQVPRSPEALARAAALLARLGRAEPKLTLSATDTLALAPLALRWLNTGVSDLEIRALLTQGLPPVVRSSRALLADRLTRKLPAPRSHAPTPTLAECATCRDPLPRGRRTGICGTCSRAAARPTPLKPPASAFADRIATLRALATPQRAQALALP